MVSGDILKGHKYLILGFEDYIASRILISKRQYRSALVLASSAVEKYLKSLLSIRRDVSYTHLNRFKSASDLRTKFKLSFLDDIDSVFIELVCQAYGFRYYDLIVEPIHIAFIAHQLLGEMDNFISIVEKEFERAKGKSELISPYEESLAQQSEFLMEDNYVLAGIYKEEYMRKPGQVYVLFFDVKLNVNELQGPISHDSYNGRMFSVKDVHIT